jgi:hypothetical protein
VARGLYIDAILKLLRVKEPGGDGVPVEDPPLKSVDSLETNHHLSLLVVRDRYLLAKPIADW